jgi:hypothetical protein
MDIDEPYPPGWYAAITSVERTDHMDEKARARVLQDARLATPDALLATHWTTAADAAFGQTDLRSPWPVRERIEGAAAVDLLGYGLLSDDLPYLITADTPRPGAHRRCPVNRRRYCGRAHWICPP